MRNVFFCLAQLPFDAFFYLRKGIATVIAFASLRFYGVEATIPSVWNGSYSNRNHFDRNLDSAKDLDTLLAESKECLKTAKDRRASITDKCKTLLTVSSLLLAISAMLLPKATDLSQLWMRVVFFVAALFLMNTIFLLLVFFGVGKETEIVIDQDDVPLESADLKKSLVNVHLRCQTDTENRTDYLVDLYQAARFFFLSAVFGVLVLFSFNFLYEKSSSSVAEEVIKRLRSDPNLLSLITGPKGEIGDKGNTGRDGKDAVIDEAAIVDRVLADARIKRAIDEAVSNANATRTIPEP